MADGSCRTRHQAGQAGYEVVIGTGQTSSPFRVLDAAELKVLWAVGPGGGTAQTNFSLGVQEVNTTPVNLGNTASTIIVVDATGSNIVLTLPPANNAGLPFGTVKTIIKKDSSTNTVTINRGVADTIGANGYTSIQLTTQGAAVTLMSDAVSVWHIIPEGFASAASQIRTVSSTPYAAVPSDYAIEADATGAAITLNLMAANSVPRGFQLKVKKIDASGNAVTVTRAGADTIEGLNTAALAAQWNSVNLTSDGVSLWLKF